MIGETTSTALESPSPSGTPTGEQFPHYLAAVLLTEHIGADPSRESDEEMLESGCTTNDHALKDAA